jgi:Tfp pilus assembly protein PilO
MVEQETQRDAELTALQSDIRSLEVTANKLQEFQREVALREAKLETLKRILPADKETPELMKKVLSTSPRQVEPADQALHGRARTVNREFPIVPAPRCQAGRPRDAPAPAAKTRPPSREYYQEWPINVDVEGTYHNLGMSSTASVGVSRLVNVGNLKIKNQPTPRASNTIAVSCVATTFVYVRSSPAPGRARQ